MSDVINNLGGSNTAPAAMPEPESKDQGIRLPPLPENSHIRIYVDKDPNKELQQLQHHSRPRSFSLRALWAMGAGLVSGAIASFGASMHAQNKMLEFDVEFKKKSVDIITGKGGLGAAVADAGTGSIAHTALPLGGLGNFGTGLSGPLIEQYAHDSLILENPEKYKFAKWMRRIGGQGNFSLGIGVATGAAVGLATYALMSDKKDHTSQLHKSEDWQSKVDNEKDPGHNLG